MIERPILFAGPMVRSILDDLKWKTRRVVKYRRPFVVREFDGEFGVMLEDERGELWEHLLCPYGEPGDRLWVKETWWHHGQWRLNWNGDPNDWKWEGWRPETENAWIDDLRRFEPPTSGIVSTRTNRQAGAMVWRLRRSIYMPRWASRLTLEITDVRVERLQDITEEDALAEGVIGGRVGSATFTAVDIFRIVWGQINGKRAPWKLNPWVFVVSFKRLEQGA